MSKNEEKEAAKSAALARIREAHDSCAAAEAAMADLVADRQIAATALRATGTKLVRIGSRLLDIVCVNGAEVYAAKEEGRELARVYDLAPHKEKKIAEA